MCEACGGTCSHPVRRSKGRTTIDVNVGGRRLRFVDAGGPAPLYVARSLTPDNAAELGAWARRNGLSDIVPADEMHVTVAYSKTPVDWFRFASWMSADPLFISPGGPRRIEAFKNGVAVLRFVSPSLSERWREFRLGGCSWDWPEYAPHITVAANAGTADLSRLKAYAGPLQFGPEEFAPITQ